MANHEMNPRAIKTVFSKNVSKNSLNLFEDLNQN